MSGWDRAVYASLMAAVVLVANAFNEAREHNFGTAVVCAGVALGFVGLWRLLRWLEARP
jgi:hypothetical protein